MKLQEVLNRLPALVGTAHFFPFCEKPLIGFRISSSYWMSRSDRDSSRPRCPCLYGLGNREHSSGICQGKTASFNPLTNSRSFTVEETTRVHREIASNIAAVAKETGVPFQVILRGDSTLRGHYPLENSPGQGYSGEGTRHSL